MPNARISQNTGSFEGIAGGALSGAPPLASTPLPKRFHGFGTLYFPVASRLIRSDSSVKHQAGEL
jgi:hypothetical protein